MKQLENFKSYFFDLEKVKAIGPVFVVPDKYTNDAETNNPAWNISFEVWFFNDQFPFIISETLYLSQMHLSDGSRLDKFAIGKIQTRFDVVEIKKFDEDRLSLVKKWQSEKLKNAAL